MAKIQYLDALEDCMVAQMEQERVFDRRKLSETGRAHAIAVARSLSGKKSKPTTESVNLAALAEALESRPDLKLVLETLAGTRPDAKALSEMSQEDFSSQFSRTIAASAGQRRPPPGSRQGVSESTPATRPDATELSEMDSSTFSNHYAATIQAAKRGR